MNMKTIRKLLVANRGEIARRVFRTCEEMGIATVAVYSDADRDAAHVREAREAVRIGEAPARDSYLNIDAVIAAAKRTSADAIHPGYGFLAENADFAQACAEAGLAFIGPRAETIRAMGSKVEARKIAEQAGVPVIPSTGLPVLVKAAAGGGGKGMRRVDRLEDLEEAKAAAAREAVAAFGDGTLLIERYLEGARHIEVQIFDDVPLYERECSIQRRHQKVIEESPAPNLSGEMRRALHDAAVRIARAVGYRSAGTAEFLVSGDEFFFLEMNTRIQVEHPVTEAVLGIDLVRMQIEGDAAPHREPRGHAIEARLYAEDPANGFLPSTGEILAWHPPRRVRVDSGIEAGMEIGIHYDPMLAKIVAHAETREGAIRKLRLALEETVVHGVVTNREYLIQVLDHPRFVAGAVSTDFAIDYRRDCVGESIARAALESFLTERRRRTRKILPGVAQGYRNNPLKAGMNAGLPPGMAAPHVSEDEKRYWVGQHVFPKVSRYPSEASSASEESASSPMPGQVLRILVEPGREVHPGEPLVILEAMKMEQTVRAHAEGIVDAVLVKPGQIVAPGETLVHLRAKEKA